MAHLDPRREHDVTASDVPAICGECVFSSPEEVMRKKVFMLRFPDTVATLHGRTLEPVAIKKFCGLTGAEVSYPGYKTSKRYEWLGGTVDGLLKMTNGDIAVLEVKCPLTRQITGEVPAQYIGQLQTYLEIYDEAKYCMFVEYKPAGPRSTEKFHITKVERDDDYMALRLPLLKNFWDDLTYKTAYTRKIISLVQRSWRTRGTGLMQVANLVARMTAYMRSSKHLPTPPRKRMLTTMVVDAAAPWKRVRKPMSSGAIFIQ